MSPPGQMGRKQGISTAPTAPQLPFAPSPAFLSPTCAPSTMNTLTKLCFRSLSPALAACLLSCGQEQKVTATPSTKEKFDTSTNEFLDLWNAGDAEGLSMLFAEDSSRRISPRSPRSFTCSTPPRQDCQNRQHQAGFSAAAPRPCPGSGTLGPERWPSARTACPFSFLRQQPVALARPSGLTLPCHRPETIVRARAPLLDR